MIKLQYSPKEREPTALNRLAKYIHSEARDSYECPLPPREVSGRCHEAGHVTTGGLTDTFRKDMRPLLRPLISQT